MLNEAKSDLKLSWNRMHQNLIFYLKIGEGESGNFFAEISEGRGGKEGKRRNNTEGNGRLRGEWRKLSIFITKLWEFY
jgi:hypothetical protein